MNNKFKIKANKQKGFTLLLSLLVISIILSVGFGVFDIMTKELKISGIGRESQIAFYATDAGVECAYFWDIKHPGLDQSAFDLGVNSVISVECGGVVKDSRAFDETKKTSFFNLDMGDSANKNQKCAKVKVTKNVDYINNVSDKITETTIESRGYNYPCNSKSSHKVERAIRVISTKTEKVE